MSELGPFEVAFLRAGPRAAIALAAGNLEHAGKVKFEGGRYEPGPDRTRSTTDHPLERAIAAAVASGSRTQREICGDQGVVAALEAVGRRLEQRGLYKLPSRGAGVLRATVFIAAGVLFTGAALVGSGGQPLPAVGMAGLGLAIVFGGLSRLRVGPTPAGRAYLAAQQRGRREIWDRRTQPETETTYADHSWLWALYGWNAIGMFHTPNVVVPGSTMFTETSASSGGTDSQPSWDGAESQPSGSADVESYFGGGESGGAGVGGDWSSGDAGGGDSGGGGDGGGGGGGGD